MITTTNSINTIQYAQEAPDSHLKEPPTYIKVNGNTILLAEYIKNKKQYNSKDINPSYLQEVINDIKSNPNHPFATIISDHKG